MSNDDNIKKPGLSFTVDLKIGDAFWLRGKLVYVIGVTATGTKCWCLEFGAFDGPTAISENSLYKE